MYSDNKLIRDVANVAARIMMGQTEIKEPQVISEELKGGQHKIDANKNNKIDAQDFKMLRSKKKVEEAAAKPDFLDLDKDGDKKEPMKKASSQMKKEDIEQQDEAMSHQAATTMKHISNPSPAQKQAAKNIKPGVGGYRDRIDMLKSAGVKEDIESIDEVKMADLPSTKVQGRSYGASKPEPHPIDVMKGPTEKQLLGVQAEKKKKKFSEMVNLYQEKGLKSLSEMLVKEEPDNEQFTKELEDAKAKSEGKKRNTEIAKGSVQAVKQEELDINAINGVQMSTIEERMMTEPEKEKKEDIVKGMKKGMAGFKERYGDRAKDVMYATATKQAMK